MLKIKRIIKPNRGVSTFFHYLLMILLPVLLLVLIRLNLTQFSLLAVALVLLSKWRTLAVKPRFWLANIRANAVDIIFGLSIVVFLANSNNIYYQLMWIVIFAFWQVAIKPGISSLVVSMQALLAQLFGLSALFLIWDNQANYRLAIVAGLICYMTARHFFDIFDDAYAKSLSYMWAFFGLSLVWLLGHWLLYYSVVSQPVVILTIIAYVLGSIYALDHKGKLTKLLKQQLIILLIAFILVILIFSNWGSVII